MINKISSAPYTQIHTVGEEVSIEFGTLNPLDQWGKMVPQEYIPILMLLFILISTMYLNFIESKFLKFRKAEQRNSEYQI